MTRLIWVLNAAAILFSRTMDTQLFLLLQERLDRSRRQFISISVNINTFLIEEILPHELFYMSHLRFSIDQHNHKNVPI